MIKLNLQSINPQEQSREMIDLDDRMIELYEDTNLRERMKFRWLAKKLLFALASDGSENVELFADHLTVSCETADDLYALREAVLDLAATLGKRWDAVVDGNND